MKYGIVCRLGAPAVSLSFKPALPRTVQRQVQSTRLGPRRNGAQPRCPATLPRRALILCARRPDVFSLRLVH